MNDISTNNDALLEEYDVQISSLIQKRKRLISQREDLKKEIWESTECYDATLRARNELEGILNNITDYARVNKEKVDSKVKLIRKMYESLERSINQPKIQLQIEELNAAMNRIKRSIEEADIGIDDLNVQIDIVEREIQRIKGMKGELTNE